MKAAVLESPGTLVCKEIPVPKLKPGEVRIAVKYCGVCGTDLHIVYDGSLRYPHIPGHELTGVVVEAADESGAALVGREVAAYGIIGCGVCEHCLSGDYSKCQAYTFVGAGCDGAMAQYVNYPVRSIVPLEGVSLHDGALIEPVAVSVHAVRLLQNPLQPAVVAGTGPIGLLTAQVLRAMGSEQVLLAGFSSRKERIVRDLGFEFVNCSVEPISERLERMGLPGGVASVLECSGRMLGLEESLCAAKPGADVVLVGIFASDAQLGSASIQAILRKELVIRGSWISSHDLARGRSDWLTAMELIRTGSIDVGRMVTDEVPLEGLADKLVDLHDRRTSDIKVLVRVD